MKREDFNKKWDEVQKLNRRNTKNTFKINRELKASIDDKKEEIEEEVVPGAYFYDTKKVENLKSEIEVMQGKKDELKAQLDYQNSKYIEIEKIVKKIEKAEKEIDELNKEKNDQYVGAYFIPDEIMKTIKEKEKEVKQFYKTFETIMEEFKLVKTAPKIDLKKVITSAPTPAQASAPTPAQASAPTPARASAPTPARASAPTPAQASAPTPARASAPTPARASAPTPAPASQLTVLVTADGVYRCLDEYGREIIDAYDPYEKQKIGYKDNFSKKCKKDFIKNLVNSGEYSKKQAKKIAKSIDWNLYKFLTKISPKLAENNLNIAKGKESFKNGYKLIYDLRKRDRYSYIGKWNIFKLSKIAEEQSKGIPTEIYKDRASWRKRLGLGAIVAAIGAGGVARI